MIPTEHYCSRRLLRTTTMFDFISKTTLTNLFHTSVGFHRRRLREIFRTHYNPFNTTHVVWTKDLSQRVVDDLRLHLSWDLGIRTFDWNRESIGTRIKLYRFKELGIFLFLKHVIITEHHLKHKH